MILPMELLHHLGYEKIRLKSGALGGRGPTHIDTMIEEEERQGILAILKQLPARQMRAFEKAAGCHRSELTGREKLDLLFATREIQSLLEASNSSFSLDSVFASR